MGVRVPHNISKCTITNYLVNFKGQARLVLILLQRKWDFMKPNYVVSNSILIANNESILNFKELRAHVNIKDATSQPLNAGIQSIIGTAWMSQISKKECQFHIVIVSQHT